jgi:large subunit ribosomal protein L9
VARIEHEKKVAAAKSAKAKTEAEQLSQKLAAVKVTIERPVGEGDRLYGSVTSRDIEEALAAQGFVVDRRRITTEPLKALGTFPVTIRLATSVSATVEVTVAKKA